MIEKEEKMKKRKGMKKFLSVAVILAMLLSAVPSTVFAGTMPEDSYGVDREWYNFRNNQENNGVTDVKTPLDSSTAALKYAVKYGTGWGAAPTPPLILDGALYVGSGNKILKLDKETGAKLGESDEMFGNVGFAMNPISYADGLLFCQVGNGSIQAIDYKTLKCVWHSKPVGGQNNSPISYVKAKDGKGYVYTGTWKGERLDGSYVCVSTGKDDSNMGPSKNGKGGYTKDVVWEFQPSGEAVKENPNLKYDEKLHADLSDEVKKKAAKRGFYWAGAYANEKYIAVGSDDGTNEGDYTANAVFYTLDPVTGDIIDRVEGIKGDIRTTTVYDNGYLYFSTKGGQLHKISVDSEGKLGEDSYIDLGGMTTASPVVYKNKIYIGVAGKGGQFDPDGGHGFAVVDNSKAALDSNSLLYKIPIKGYPQASALVSTAYVNNDFDGDGKPDGRVYIYFTYNAQPGGIYYTYDTADQKAAAPMSKELFVPPAEQQQYCISTICADREGTLYYKNDSCYVMAVETNPAVLTSAKLTDDAGKEITLNRGFDQTVTDYTAKVALGTKSVYLELDAPKDAKVTVDGKAYEKGMKVDFAGEAQDIKVRVKVGKHSKVYEFSLKRMSTAATLSELKVSESNAYNSKVFEMTPEFSESVQEYTIDMTDKKSPNFYRVWPKASAEGATIEVVAGDNVDRIEKNPERAYHSVYPKDINRTLTLTVKVKPEAGGDKTTDYKITILKNVKAESIELDKKEMTLDVTDDAVQLNAKVLPESTTDKSVSWSSLKDDVASVDKGLVTPKAAGKTDVAAVSNSNANLMAKCAVTVTDKAADVDALIGKIGNVDINTKGKIDAARKAYDALNQKQKDRVTKLDVLLKAENDYENVTSKPAGYAYISVDKATLGQGYLIEPVKVPFYEGENGAQLLNRAMEMHSFELEYTGKLEDGFYLSAVKNAGGDLTAKFPAYLQKYIDENKVNVENPRSSESLGEFDYTNQSGWVYKYDNKHAPVGASGVKCKDGMVFRWSFTVCGYGSDCWNTGWGNPIAPYAVNKDNLIKKVADFKASEKFDELMKSEEVKAAYDNLIKAGTDNEIEQPVIDKAIADLDKAVKFDEMYAEEAAEVDAKIAAIGEVTLEKETLVTDARIAYATLSEGAKAKVTKLAELEAAEAKIADLKLAAQKLSEAKEAAKSELAGYKDLDEYRDAEKAELNKIVADAVKAVEAAGSVEAVDKIVKDAKAQMDKVKTDAQLTEEENAGGTKPEKPEKPEKPDPGKPDPEKPGSGNAGSTDKPSANTESNVNKPAQGVQTGDNVNIALYAGLLAIAVIAVLAVVFRRKKTNK